MQIEQYRPRLEQFHHNLNQELYLHYSGLKEKLETAGLYSDYLGPLQSGDHPGNSSLKSIVFVLTAPARRRWPSSRFCGGTPPRAQQPAPLAGNSRRSKPRAPFPGATRKICLTQVPLYLANEPDALSRRRLNELRAQVIDGSNSLRQERGSRPCRPRPAPWDTGIMSKLANRRGA